MEDDVIICRCQEVRATELLDAVRRENGDMDAIKIQTRAGMGLCQGRTCKPLLARIIARETGRDPGSIIPSTFRPPIRPIKFKHMKLK
jgi:NAD(P)H-nitrite reductase large subunit